jgi:hypothetical protein
MRILSPFVALSIVALGAACTPGSAPRTNPTVRLATASPSRAPASTPGTSPSATAAATAPAAAGLPEGPFFVEQPEGAPGITVSIPGPGWKFHAEFDALEKGAEVANLPEAAILLWSWPAGTEFFVSADPCRSESTRPDTPATTADEIAADLEAQESRDASAPQDVTVDGYAGKSITLRVPDDAVFTECEQGEFASYGTEAEALSRTHQGPGQIDELWIIDVDGAIVILDAMYRSDTPEELVQEMRSIAQSATFETP